MGRKKLNILAADDEELGCRQLVRAIKEVAPKENLIAFQDSNELLKYAKDHPCDVAFLDIEMGSISGLEIAKQLKLWYPKVNIVFVSGYNQYMAKAFKLRVSGYVLKPIKKEDIKEELEGLRIPVMPVDEKALVAKCFGTFDVFVNGQSLKFKRSKSKEMFAYLIDRRGNAVTSGELRTVLWEDAKTDHNTGVYLQLIKKDLIRTLKEVGVEDIFITSRNKYAINPKLISCDYYDYLENKPEGIRAYNGEYMEQYQWGIKKWSDK